MQEFDEKFSYFFVARGLMGRIVQKVCVFLKKKACFRAVYCSICIKNTRARGRGGGLGRRGYQSSVSLSGLAIKLL